MAGRPPKYKNADEMQLIIDGYFDSCKGEIVTDESGMPVFNKNGKLLRDNVKIPTITGLALALGFNSRQSLLNYQGRKQFVDTITRAKLRVEEYVESRLYDRDGARGAEFSLRRNFGWRDDDEKKPNDYGILPAVLEFVNERSKQEARSVPDRSPEPTEPADGER